MTARPRWWLSLALAPIVATAVLFAPVSPAGAAPKEPPSADEGEDNPVLRDVLDSTGRAYLAADRAYTKATKAQLKAAIAVRDAEVSRDKLLPEAGAVAAESYRTGSLSTVGFLLNSRDSKTFIKRAVSLNEMNALNDKKLRELNKAIDTVATSKAELDRAVEAQRVSRDKMASQKKAAEKALNLLGGNTVTKGLVDFNSAKASPAPRTSDGDWPRESCSEDDPTTGGCITPRTEHMYKEVKKAGFDRFVGCHRNGGPFEHPKGRACDWSLQNSGFAPWHNNDTFRYGNDLMAFLVRNADRLGVLYVIWNRQIWQPASGWHSYSGPSAHIDHVHVSML